MKKLLFLLLLSLPMWVMAQTDGPPVSPIAKPITSYWSISGTDSSLYLYVNSKWIHVVGRNWMNNHAVVKGLASGTNYGAFLNASGQLVEVPGFTTDSATFFALSKPLYYNPAKTYSTGNPRLVLEPGNKIGLDTTSTGNAIIPGGLVLSASGTTASVTAGSWVINGTTYSTSTTTNLTIPAQDATLSQYIAVYATTTTPKIDTAEGVLSATPVEPNIPANTILIGYVLITPTSVTTPPLITGFVPIHGYTHIYDQKYFNFATGVNATNGHQFVPLNQVSSIAKAKADSVNSSKIDVFEIIGQSNAAGVAVVDTSFKTVNGNVYFYGGNVYPANDPFLGYQPGAHYKGGMWPSFGNKYTTLTGRKVCFVQASKGGSAMIPVDDVLGNGYWSRGVNSLYPQAATALQHCLDSLVLLGYTPILKGILISQGESDALYIGNGTVSANAYRDSLISLHQRFQNQFYAYNQNLPMYVFRTGAHNPSPDYLSNVRAPQEDAANHDSLLFVVARNAVTFVNRHLMNPDTVLAHLHYSEQGYHEMGITGAEDVVLNAKIENPVVRQYTRTGFGGITEPTAYISTQASNDTIASLNIPIGIVPATRVYEGDIYNSSSHHLLARLNGTWVQLDNPSLLGIANGGTNNTSYTTYSVPYFDGTKLAEDNLNFYYKPSTRQFNIGTSSTPGNLTVTGKTTLTSSIVSSTGDVSRNAWGVVGPSLSIGTRNITDTTTTDGSTVSNTAMVSFGVPTLKATLATTGITYNNVANVYIAGDPVAGTNITIPNPYALWAVGHIRFSSLSTGLAHVNSLGVLSSSTLATADITNNAVTYAKIQAGTTNKLYGTGSGTAFGEITLGTNLSFTGTTLNATGGTGTVTSITPGYGFTSSTPITTSGTMTIDTTKLTTIANKNGIVPAWATNRYAPLASPGLTGVPTAPTAALLTNTTQIATTAFVNNGFLKYGDTTAFAGTLVHINGTETINGAKTFSNYPLTESYAVGNSISNFTSGLFVSNPTVATATGTYVQPSPALQFDGSAMGTIVGLPMSMRVVMQPTYTGSNPQGQLVFQSNSNNIGWITNATLDNSGDFYTKSSGGAIGASGSISTAVATFGQGQTSLGTTNVQSVLLNNGQVATAGTPVQNSPTLDKAGFGWQTSGTPTSVAVTEREKMLPISGATVAGSHIWGFTIGGGAFTQAAALNSSGDFSPARSIILKGFTVATLPTGVVGMTAYVTDSLSPVALATVVGGGSNTVPVFYNGTNWIVQ